MFSVFQIYLQILGVFFIKASAYKVVEENSKHGKDSYFYSIEHKSQKSFCHASMLKGGKPHDDFDPGKYTYIIVRYIHTITFRNILYLKYTSLIQYM